MASTMAQGLAFGTGSAVAHRAVDAVAGSMGGGDDAAPADGQQQQFGGQEQQQMPEKK